MSIPEEDLLDQAVRHYIKVGAEWDDGDTVPFSTARVALLDAAHAYGLATGREGFHRPGEETVLRSLPHDLTPGALRASIDATGRAVDDVDRRLAEAQAANEGLMNAVQNLALGAGETARITTLLTERIRSLEESRSASLQAITHLKMNQGEPAWTKPDLDDLLGRVVALEASLHQADVRADLALAQKSHLVTIETCRATEKALEQEKAEHAETRRRYEERGAELEREKGLRAAAERSIREVIEALPYGDIRAFVDEPPF